MKGFGKNIIHEYTKVSIVALPFIKPSAFKGYITYLRHLVRIFVKYLFIQLINTTQNATQIEVGLIQFFQKC